MFSIGILHITNIDLSVPVCIHGKSPSLSANIQANPTVTESVDYLEEDELYNDLLHPESRKIYVIRASEKSLLILYLLIDTENGGLEVEVEGAANRTRINVVWSPQSHVYYVGKEGEIRILLSNHQTSTIYYRFYVDISKPLSELSSKILPLEGGQVAFDIDLRKDDKVLLCSSPDGTINPRIRVFALYNVIVPEGTFYSLCQYGPSSYRSSSFTADLGGTYYIVVDLEQHKGAFSLMTTVVSPPWNQEWFWLAILFALCAAATFFINIGQVRDLDRTAASTLISYYLSLITTGLAISAIGSLSYGTSHLSFLLYLLMVFYGLGHGLQIYASFLDRKKIVKACPFCGRQVNITADNYCCGHMVKRLSFAWFFMPLSLSFFFFSTGCLIFESAFPEFLDHFLWIAGCGSIIGGIIAWRMNSTIYGAKSWKLLAEGILFSIISPFLILFLLNIFFSQHTELLVSPGFLWIRTRVAGLTLPFHITLISIMIFVGLMVLIAVRSRRTI